MCVLYTLTLGLVCIYVCGSHPNHSIGVCMYVCVFHTLTIALVCICVCDSHPNHSIGVLLTMLPS